MRLTVLNPFDKNQDFPNAEQALREPDGLLAVGGCLSPERLVKAYRYGIFPWYNAGEPILWWSPDPRLILLPEKMNVSRSLKKMLRREEFRVTVDEAFAEVLEGCAKPRAGAAGTWITGDIKRAYLGLYHRGIAHSIEVWQGSDLVGGLYGVALGRIFFGESMFHRLSNASKIALVRLCEMLHAWNYALIDCQVRTDHLLGLGAKEIPRKDFLRLLEIHCNETASSDAWTRIA